MGNQQPALFNNFISLCLKRGVICIKRKRKDYSKIKRPIYPITFTDNYYPPCPIAFEEWRYVDIDGVIKNYYLISNMGTLVNIKGQIIKPYQINSGYYIYKLYTGSIPKYKSILVQRLVMMTFHPIENPELFTVNHENRDPSENMDYNLSWMTQSENNLEKERNGHYFGSNNYHAIFNQQQLKIIVNELEKGTKYKDILNIIGIEDTPNNRDYIGNIKRGKTYQREIKLLNG